MHIKLKCVPVALRIVQKMEEILIVFDSNIWFSKEVTMSLMSKWSSDIHINHFTFYFLVDGKEAINQHSWYNYTGLSFAVIAWLRIQGFDKSQENTVSPLATWDLQQRMLYNLLFINQWYISFISVKFILNL